MNGNGVRVSLGKAVAAPDSMMDAEKLTRWQGSSRGATGKEKHEAFHKRRAAVTAASRFARPRRAPTRQSVYDGPSLHVGGAVCGALQAVAAVNGNAARRWHPKQQTERARAPHKGPNRAARASCTAVLRKCVVVPSIWVTSVPRRPQFEPMGLLYTGATAARWPRPRQTSQMSQTNKSNKRIKQIKQTIVQNRVKLAVIS